MVRETLPSGTGYSRAVPRLPCSLIGSLTALGTAALAALTLAACGSVAGKSPDAASGTGGSSSGGIGGAADAGDAAPTSDSGNPGGPDAAADGLAAPCNLARPFGAPAIVSSLNTGFLDIDVWLTADSRTAIVASNHTGAGGPGGFDLYTAGRAAATGDFGAATPLPVVNGVDTDRKPVLSPDSLKLFFSSNRLVGDGGTGLNIFVATRPNPLSDFGTPGPLAGVNSSGVDYAGSVSGDGRTLYFDSVTTANRDILTKDLTSSSPPAPVAELNSAGNDAFPVVSLDGRTIYFASIRALPGAAGDAGASADAGVKMDFDIWVARRATASGPFSDLAPVNELNTASTDVPNWISPDGCTIYISTDRNAPNGDRHIWAASKPAN